MSFADNPNVKGKVIPMTILDTRLPDKLCKVNSYVNSFVVHNKRFSRYAGRVSGAARREEMFERNCYIVVSHDSGVSFTELAHELGFSVSTISRAYHRHKARVYVLWGKLSFWARVAKRKYAKYVYNRNYRAWLNDHVEKAHFARTLFTAGLGVVGFSFSPFLYDQTPENWLRRVFEGSIGSPIANWLDGGGEDG